MADRKKDLAWVRFLNAKGIDLGKASLPIELSMADLQPLGGMQARNMLSMNERSECPPVFREHGCFPLALDTERFSIVRGDAWFDFPEAAQVPDHFDAHLPFELLSPEFTKGEGGHILRLQNSGYLRQFIGSDITATHFGRTTTVPFTVRIGNVPIHVKAPQIDNDLVYESAQAVYTIEAKAKHNPSCNVRQVYYPWRNTLERLHGLKSRKASRTIFMTFDERTDDYIVRELTFQPHDVWEGIQVTRSARAHVRLIPPKKRVLELDEEALPSPAVPQADDVLKVRQFPFLVSQGINKAAAWVQFTGLDIRQANYYRLAAEILDLVYTDHEATWRLTERGREFVARPPDRVSDELARIMCRARIVRHILILLEAKGENGLTTAELDEIVDKYAREAGQPVAGATVHRRAQTCAAWLSFIGSQSGLITYNRKAFYLREDFSRLDDFMPP